MTETRRRQLRRSIGIAILCWIGAVAPASAQQPMADVLTFLLTNRSVPTGDFDRDERAASETRDVFVDFLALEQSIGPLPSTSGGFTYRSDVTSGVFERSSTSFGPYFTDRALTVGRGHGSVRVGFHAAAYTSIDGRDLRDGTLVSTASTLRGEVAPFDVETTTLRLSSNALTLSGNYGVTDRLDLSASVQMVRVALSGERVDTYRGATLVQATANASAEGLGDIVVRGKYNLVRSGASGMAVATEVRLPTGDEANLLGAGRTTVTPQLIGSYEGARLGVHGQVGYSLRNVSRAVGYSMAVTAVATPAVTVVGELLGLRLDGIGRLVESTEPHPRLLGVDTIRLRGVEQSSNRLMAVAGVKWNIASTWIVTASVRRSLTSTGLNAAWVPTVTFDVALPR